MFCPEIMLRQYAFKNVCVVYDGRKKVMFNVACFTSAVAVRHQRLVPVRECSSVTHGAR